MALAATQLRLMSRALKTFSRIDPLGRVRPQALLPRDCGTRIYHDNGEPFTGILPRPGTLDDKANLPPSVSLSVRSRQAWRTLLGDMVFFESLSLAMPPRKPCS